MQFLKQSTAFTLRVGPILDSTGVEYSGAVIGDLSITKNGTTAAMAAAATLTYDANGYYSLVGTTGNSDTLGRLDITCNKSTYQMPPVRLQVLAAAAFDTIVTNGTIASTTSGRTITTDAAGLVDANAVKMGPSGSGTALTARDIGLSVLLSAGTGTGQLDFTSGVVKGNTTQWLGGAIPAVNVTGVPKVDLVDWLGTAPLSLSSQQVQSVVPTSTVVASVTGAVGSVTGAVGSVTGAVGSISGVTFPTNFSLLSIDGSGRIDVGKWLGTAPLVLSSQQVQAVVPSSTVVASVTGAVGSVTSNVNTNANSTETAIKAKTDQLTFTTSLHVDATASIDAASVRTALGMASANLDSQLSEIQSSVDAINTGAGSGAHTVTITVNDGTNPLQNATVTAWVNNSQQGSVATNASGVGVLALDSATYTLNVTCPGYDGSSSSLVVNGNVSHTYSLTQTNITPSTGSQTTAYLTVVDATGAAKAGVSVRLTITALATGTGLAVDDPSSVAVTGSNGLVQFSGQPQGASYSVYIGSGGGAYKGTLASASTSPLVNSLGQVTA